MTDKILEEAEGYCLLEMYDDALEVLNELRPPESELESVLLMRVTIHSQQKDFESGARVAFEGLRRYPENVDLYLTGSWCVRRFTGLADAYSLLCSAADRCPCLPALWYYNMACYECQLGNLDEVAGYYERAIAMDESFEAVALEDDDLGPWFDSLDQNSAGL